MIRIRSWWHAGEEGAVAIYRKNMFQTVALLLLFIIIWIFLPLSPQERMGGLVMTAGYFPLLFAERRRAIIFNNAEIIYRPPWSKVRRVPIAGIAGMRKSVVAQAAGIRAKWTPGVLLTMATGETVTLPLDVGKTGEILYRLSNVTARPLEGYQLGKVI